MGLFHLQILSCKILYQSLCHQYFFLGLLLRTGFVPRCNSWARLLLLVLFNVLGTRDHVFGLKRPPEFFFGRAKKVYQCVVCLRVFFLRTMNFCSRSHRAHPASLGQVHDFFGMSRLRSQILYLRFAPSFVSIPIHYESEAIFSCCFSSLPPYIS